MNKQIIDCHRHLSLDKKYKTFEEATKALVSDMESNQISKSVIIADNVKNSGTADIDTLMEVFKNNENIYFVGAINPFDQPVEELSRIESLLANKKIIGLKLYNGHDKLYLSDERCVSSVKLCDKYQVPLMIHTGVNSGDPESAKYNDPKMIVEIAKKYPKTKIVISHFYWPKIDYCYEITRNVDNIYFDTSAMADDEVIEKSGGIDKIKEVLKKTVKDRNNRLIFGTDYPMCSLKKHIDLIESLDISGTNKKNIFCKNVVNIFNLYKNH